MSPLLPILGLAAAAFFVLRKPSPPAQSPEDAAKDAYLGMTTAHAYLASEPKKGVPIEIDVKALAGKPLGVMMVTPQEGPIAADFPDGRKGRAMIGSITDGKGVGAVMLYFV